ncbi:MULTISPECIES: hypothetical protein [unclassified Streptomyces]|uniref:hypothetical protein n=1 Tax=unclassified Streptomyces TaxID=2593676 RepID=UPI0033AC403B
MDTRAPGGNPPPQKIPYDARGATDMTVPEENRPKTQTTDEVLEQPDENRNRPPGATGRTMREALEEAEVRPDDYDER